MSEAPSFSDFNKREKEKEKEEPIKSSKFLKFGIPIFVIIFIIALILISFLGLKNDDKIL